MILIHRGVPADPTFRINLLSSRVPEGSCAAKKDCCEIHEKIRVFLETFLIANLPDEILTNYTMIQGIWQHLREEGFGKSESGEPLQAIPIPCFQERGRPTSLDRGNCPMSVTNNHAAGIGTCTQSGMTIPSCLSSEMPSAYPSIRFAMFFSRVNRSDDNMRDVCFQDSQLTSDPTTTPQQCNKGDRQRCQSS